RSGTTRQRRLRVRFPVPFPRCTVRTRFACCRWSASWGRRGMTGSPLDPLVHLLTTLAIAIGAAALITLSAVLFLRFLGLHWSWTLPGVLLGPALWPFDQ